MGKRITILALLVLAVWAIYWVLIRCAFNGDFVSSGQFGDSFGALNTLFTGWAFVVVLVTLIQQWRQIEQTKRDLQEERQFRLRLDLYERRFRIYMATVDFIGNVVCDKIGVQQMVDFGVARSEAFFLFAGDEELIKYLEELKGKAADLAGWKEQAKAQAQPGSEESQQREKLNNWFHAQVEASRQKFMTHLSFR